MLTPFAKLVADLLRGCYTKFWLSHRYLCIFSLLGDEHVGSKFYPSEDSGNGLSGENPCCGLCAADVLSCTDVEWGEQKPR